ncbi:MAG: GIY-YIG nuclease family protein [Candidatus Omnitrophica bacterium]|nr:GIY-YIG nuclease family protein [Candidatus Omnitrophota bacterium]
MWSVYIIECKDGKLYTGTTNNLKRRLKEHNAGYGGRFTRFRKPVKLVYSQKMGTKSEALGRESDIKKLRREQKLELIRSFGFSHTVEASGQFLA